MKRLLVVTVAALSLTACASTRQDTKKVEVPTFPTVPDFDIRALNRSEVIAAIDQCEASNMKPFVEYLTQKTAYGKVLVPVNVHCNPERRLAKQ